MKEAPGEGPVISTDEAKDRLGRGFMRVKHTGRPADQTAWEAGKLVGSTTGPTKLEIQMMRDSLPGEVNMWHGLGLTYEQIYEKLKHKL